jgi:ferricrocin synthase
MELSKSTLTWTSACEEVIFDNMGMDDLVGKLDSVLQHIMQSPNSSAIELTEGGIAICGLPAFKSKESEGAKGHSRPNNVSCTSEPNKEWNGTESAIRKVLSEVSRVPEREITKQQTIFNLGLDSIIAIKVSSLLRKRSINLSVSDLLKATSIYNMAQLANAKQENAVLVKKDNENLAVHPLAHINVQEVMQIARIDPNSVQKILPCSPGQVYMLSAWQNREGSEFYSTFQYMAPKLLDKTRLNQAWDTLCETTSILKTMFASTGDRQIPFLQIVLKQNHNPVIWLSQPSLDGQLNANFSKPLVSLAVVSPNVSSLSDSARPSLFLKIHHALYDGVSLNLLVQQLGSLYQDPSMVHESESQYEDFLAQELTGVSQISRENFWSVYLSKSNHILLPLIDLSPGYSRYERKSPYTPRIIQSISSLSTAARAENVSFQALFLASYAKVHAKLLSRLRTDITKRRDIIFGVYLANRSHPLSGLPTLPAPTVNLVPLRIRDALHAPILEVAKNIQLDLHLISSIENSRVGLWEVFDWTGVLLDCFVNFLTLPDSEDSLECDKTEGLSLDLEHVALDPGSMEYMVQVGNEREWFQDNFKWSQANAVKDVYRVSRLPPNPTFPPIFHLPLLP